MFSEMHSTLVSVAAFLVAVASFVDGAALPPSPSPSTTPMTSLVDDSARMNSLSEALIRELLGRIEANKQAALDADNAYLADDNGFDDYFDDSILVPRADYDDRQVCKH